MLDMRTFFAGFPDAAVLLSPDLHIIDFSDMWLVLMGKTVSEVKGVHLFDAFPANPDAMASDLRETLTSAASTGKVQKLSRVRYDLVNQDGETAKKYWEISVSPVKDSDGAVYLLQRVEDITEHVLETTRLEDRVRVNRMTSLIIQNLRDHAVILLDLTGVIASWNPGAERIKGYTAQEIIGKHFSIFYTAEDLANNVSGNALEAARQTGRYELEGWRKRKDGGTFWANVVITRVDDETGIPVGFVKITRDLTEKKNAENALVRAFEDSTRQRAEFTASMSHEIRNPMNGVVSAARLLQTAGMQEENKALVSIILDSSESLLSIVNDILDYAKLDVSHFNLLYKPFNIQNEITYTVNLARINGRDKTAASIELQFSPTLPSAVDGDAIRLRQVLTNLLDNAVKFTREGTICVKVWDSDPKETIQGDVFTLHVAVEDTGYGIAEEELGKLFKPFSQTSTSTQTPYRGSGLGLSICKRILELMGGRISVRSVQGKGTTFAFHVPLVVSHEAVEDRSTQELQEKRGGHAQAARLLVVDDSLINRRVLVRLLQRLGFINVAVVENGQDAVSFAEKEPQDLILMDLQMPVMDGFEATRLLREKGHQTPIVALTGDALPQTAVKCQQAGMNACLVKPVKFDELDGLLERLIRPPGGAETPVPEQNNMREA